jgi:hypothetical protein
MHMDKAKVVTNKTFGQYLAEFETQLNDIFGKKAPALPDNVKEFIVKYGPYIALVLLVINLPIILAAIGLSAIFAPMAALGGVNAFTGLSLGIIFLIITVTLQALALPGLFKRALQGWRLLFYSSLFSLVYSLLTGSLVSGLIGVAIGFYFLFQIRPYYK